MNEQNQLSAQDLRRTKLSALAVMIAAVAYYFLKYRAGTILPIIAGDLDGMAYYTWAAVLYSLTSCIAAPFWGKMGDMIGRRKVLLWLLGFLTVGDIIMAAAPNIFVYIVASGISGFGGGAMLATFYSILADLFPPDKRGIYGGYILVIMNVITIFLPLLTAQIAQRASWRYVFVMSAIIYVLAMAAVYFLLPKHQKELKKLKIDMVGIALITIGAVPFLLALSWGGSKYAWSDPIIVVMLVVAVVFLGSAAVYEKKHEEFALLSIKLLRNRNYVFAILVSLFMTSTMSAFGTYGPLLVQGVMGHSATVWATASIPSAVIGIFAGGLSGWAMDKTKRYKWLLMLAPFCGSVTMVFFKLLTPAAPIAFIVGISIFNRVMTGYMPSINSLAAMAQVEEQDYGAGGGTLFFITGLGQAIWPAILGSIFNGTYSSTLTKATASIAKQLTPAQLKAIATSRILVTPASMKALQATFGNNTALYNQTVEAVRTSLHSAVNACFIIAAIFSLGAVVMAILIKEVPLDQIKYGKKR